MKILDVSTYSPTSRGFGGITRSTTAYLKLFLAMGFDTYFLGPDGSLDGRVTESGIRMALPNLNVALYTPIFHKKWGVGPGLFRHLALVPSADFIFFHGARTFTTILVGAVARIFRKRYAVVAHSGLDRDRMLRTYRKRPLTYLMTEPFVRFSVNGAERIVVSGRNEHDMLDVAFRKVPVTRIENFFDLDIPFNPPDDIQHGRHYIFVGRIDSDKGLLSFIRAWQAVASQNDRFCVVGSGTGAYADEVFALIRADERITHEGEMPQKLVYEYIAKSHVLVLSTGLDDPVGENFGNVVAESLIHSRPVMVTRGMHWDEYAGYQAVILFEPTIEAVARSIEAFSALDQGKYNEMCAVAYQLGKRFGMANARERVGAIIDGRRPDDA